MSPKVSGMPTLIVYGDDDQLVPVDASAYKSSEFVEEAPLKVYEGTPHGLILPHKAWLNEDLVAFLSE